MKKRMTVLTIAVVLVASPLRAPTTSADPFHGRSVGGGRGVAHSFTSHPFVPHQFSNRFFHHPFFHNRFFHNRFFHDPFFRPIIPFGVIASPVVVYAPPPVIYGAPTSYAPPGIYDPPIRSSLAPGYSPPVTSPVPVALPAPAPPMPSVIEYATGRYELRGDGETAPYRWVWIPNPPSAPPPESAAGTPLPPAPPASGDRSPGRRSQLYHWTDAQGVEHWTNRADAVPERDRAPAKPPNS